MNARESLIAALREAAEVEHGITCQYLFAAFSLKSHPEEGVDWVRLEQLRGWKAELLRLARQEMMHHGLVCNLLLSVGGAPHFGRGRMSSSVSVSELRPFGQEALECFAAYESSHAPGPGRDIDALYARIGEELARADLASAHLFLGPEQYQVTNQELRIRPGQFDVELTRVSSLASALEVIRRIREHGHEERIDAMRGELAGLLREDSTFAPARPVAPSPWVVAPVGTGKPAVELRHPRAREAAALFNAAYEAMLLMLSRLYHRSDEPPSETEVLTRAAFFPFMTAVIRPLGELLTLMPATDEAATPTAGAPFELQGSLTLPPAGRTAWAVLHERLEGLASGAGALVGALRQDTGAWVPHVLPRLELLQENLERIATDFELRLGLRREALLRRIQRLG